MVFIEACLRQAVADATERFEAEAFTTGDGLLWTLISRDDWCIAVSNLGRNYPVKISHTPCLNDPLKWMWWGDDFREPRQMCWNCGEMIGVETEDYLLKAWELFSC